MNDEPPDGGFSIESLGEDTVENARLQLALLEKSLVSSREPAEAVALLDEAYRAAQSLKSAIDSRRMPNVDRLARRLQDVVRATRAGSLAVTPELGSMLASVARIARDALDAGSGGGAEPKSVSSAAASLEEVLAHPGAWTVPPAISGVTVHWARVEAARLIAAGEAAGDAKAASAAFARAAEDSAGLEAGFQSALAAHDHAMQRLREALPAGLGRVARGEQTTTVAAELAEIVSSLSMNASGLAQSMGRCAAAVKEAAFLGNRAAMRAEAVFGSLRSVRLDALLEDIPRLVRRTARAAGRAVDLVQDSTNLEVDAARAETVRSLISSSVRAMIGLSASRGKKIWRGGAGQGAELTIFARAAGEDLYLRIALTGGAPDAERLRVALAPAKRRLVREGGTIEVESEKGAHGSILLTIRSAAALMSRSAEFIVARAGDTWFAILATSVVECIEAGLSMQDYVLEGARLPTLRMNDTRDPREGVVVRTPRGGAVLLFDAVGGREFALQSLGGNGLEAAPGISGLVRRPDGSSARLVDLADLLPAPERRKGRGSIARRGRRAQPGH
ncbi:MAG: hypothetical protein ABSG21_11085 [Spirochaetia bacterium]|jgi:chemotaxis protein histidine kinase CheA